MDKSGLYSRFLESIEYLKDNGKIHKQQDLADTMGVSKSYISDVIKDRGGKFSESFLRRYADTFSEFLNPEYLLHGVGMIGQPTKYQRPHITARASAGFLDGISNAEMIDETGMWELNDFMTDYDFTIEVSGDSMTPEFCDGDIVLARLLRDGSRLPVGRICILDTTDGPLLKEIKRMKRDCIVLHSLNPEYEDFELEYSSLLQVAIVVGSIRSYD
ncbi:MAG: hypothetical protein HDR80_02385 [Bacteroides sp.]|nr:hypothetical protein [Bacteroides sp.]